VKRERKRSEFVSERGKGKKGREKASRCEVLFFYAMYPITKQFVDALGGKREKNVRKPAKDRRGVSGKEGRATIYLTANLLYLNSGMTEKKRREY